jgi:hypothetical protein
VIRRKNRYREEGAVGLVHKGRGKASKRSSKATSYPRPSLAACWRPWGCALLLPGHHRPRDASSGCGGRCRAVSGLLFAWQGSGTVEAANDFLGTYAEQMHNLRFTGAPARNGSRAPLRQHPRGAGMFTLLNP